MRVNEAAKALGLTVYNEGTDREITTGYCCDLLSWALSHAKEDSAWITVMNHENVAAVALLAGVACVIISDGIVPTESLLSGSKRAGLTLLGSSRDSFSLAVEISKLLG